ncbi:MAG: nucleoside-diphosphate sugar epimerase, partial [Candidatus Omnitrophica bacterium]|nr:nucleoside-diphosphate sugar epimerase [Candidatus Omnitrophota bacterium]
ICIEDLATMIWKMIRDTKPKIKFIPYDKLHKGYEDVMRRVPDTRKAEKFLGFKASVQLEKGMPLTIEWQRSVTQ